MQELRAIEKVAQDRKDRIATAKKQKEDEKDQAFERRQAAAVNSAIRAAIRNERSIQKTYCRRCNMDYLDKTTPPVCLGNNGLGHDWVERNKP